MRRDRDALRWLSSLPRAAWPVVAMALGGLLAFALPDSVRLPWWAPSTLDLVVVTVLGIAFARSRFAVLCGVVASVLSAHAVLVGLARPSTTAAVLWALAAVGVLVALLGRAERARLGAALALLVIAPATHATTVTAGGSAVFAARITLTAAVVAVGAAAVVLVVVALHELALLWDLLPRWVPLTVAGLGLVGLAMTYERRRRDLARVRKSLSEMS